MTTVMIMRFVKTVEILETCMCLFGLQRLKAVLKKKSMFLFYFCFNVIAFFFLVKQNSFEINDSFHLHSEVCVLFLEGLLTHVLAVESQRVFQRSKDVFVINCFSWLTSFTKYSAARWVSDRLKQLLSKPGCTPSRKGESISLCPRLEQVVSC